MQKATLACLAMICVGLTPASAQQLEGEKLIRLIDNKGTEVVVDSIRFDAAGEHTTYEVIWDETQFNDHFLSMRPFRCLEGSEKYWCRVPYPYTNNRTISAEDLTDLEYDLLFLWKGASEYGINLWNGVYYKLETSDDGLSGTLNEIDMNVLSAPPADGSLRPIRERDIHVAEPASHWLPKLRIE